MLVLAIFSVVAAALLEDCAEDNTQDKCVDLELPAQAIIESTDILCGQMPNMPGCTVAKYCKLPTSKPLWFCKPLSVLGDICANDMPRMGECRVYTKICGGDTVVKQCINNPHLLILPTTKQAKAAVADICSEMDMTGCEKCKDGKCEYMQIYSRLCNQMPGMKQCKTFNALCTLEPQFPNCPSSDSKIIAAPTMKMFFHFGYADYILFESWVPYNGATFLMGCIFCFLMGFFYETSLYYARQLERNWLPSFGPPPRQQDVYLGVANNSPNQASPEPLLPRSHSHDISDDQRFARDDATFAISNAAKLQGWTPLKVRTTSAVMRFVLIAFAYLCMLIIMTYNIWLCVFVVMGMAMGVFVWPHSSIPQKEHCC